MLAGLSTRGAAHEAARVVAYDAQGAVVESLLVHDNGRTALHFDAPVRYALVEAAGWQGEGPLPSGNPDLSLVWIDAL